MDRNTRKDKSNHIKVASAASAHDHDDREKEDDNNNHYSVEHGYSLLEQFWVQKERGVVLLQLFDYSHIVFYVEEIEISSFTIDPFKKNVQNKLQRVYMPSLLQIFSRRGEGGDGMPGSTGYRADGETQAS